MSQADRPRRRWLQFGLRTALWLVVVAALGLGWWRDRAEMRERIARLELLQEAQLLMQQPSRSSSQLSRSFSRSFAARQLGSRGDYQVDPLPEFRDAVQLALRDRGRVYSPFGSNPRAGNDEVVQTLIGILAEPDPQRRAQAACTLAMLGADAAPAVGELQRLLADPEPSVRWHALLALGRIGPDAAPAADAVRKLMDDDESGMPAFAAQMLLQIDPDAAVADRLAALLSHRNASTRRRALLALTQLESDSARSAVQAAVPAMVAMLEDDDKSTRMAAIEAVGKLAPRDVARKAITAAFQREDDARLRRMAAEQLIRLETQGETDK